MPLEEGSYLAPLITNQIIYIMQKERIFLLQGSVQNYAWGGYQFLPALLNIANPEGKPFAEYWMGAHNSAPSTIDIAGKQLALNQQIQENPTELLGTVVWEKFGELPYLFKILDVKDMLSIQVHPTKEEAEKGFDAEEAAGIPITDKKRNYKDRNHKPEVMVALSEFWLLHGFLAEEKLTKVLETTPAFQPLLPVFRQNGYKGLYQQVMELPQQQVDALLAPLVTASLENPTTDKSLPDYWVAKLYPQKPAFPLTDIDKGVFSIYFFNIVKAMPGEAVFQGAGVPHAYLEGQNVELMANSDNVLRGGLTPKHIDVPELLKHTIFEGVVPNLMQGQALPNGEVKYPCPIDDFGITRIDVKANTEINAVSQSAEIVIALDGDIHLHANEGETEEAKGIHLFKGEAAFILPATDYIIRSNDGGLAYKAFVPFK